MFGNFNGYNHVGFTKLNYDFEKFLKKSSIFRFKMQLKNNQVILTVIIWMSRRVWIYAVNVIVLFTTNSWSNVHNVVCIRLGVR